MSDPIWSKETPKEEGWYWMRYENKRGKITEVPAEVIFVDEATLVKSARNDDFIEGPHHGGPGLKCGPDYKVDKSVRFGPKIPRPGE